MILHVVVRREGDRWGVAIDRELMALTADHGEAARLARDAAQILRDSGAKAHVRIAPDRIARERRSFKPED
jgi:hypothetical protein